MTESVTTHDQRARYCPMLGHQVPFTYCRRGADGVACRRVVDCWRETFDVEGFLRCHLDDAQMERIGAPRDDKVATLVELIARARRAQTPEDQ